MMTGRHPLDPRTATHDGERMRCTDSGQNRQEGPQEAARGAIGADPDSQDLAHVSGPIFRLCYVEGPWAYFTTQAVTEQRGDDWDDAPYECNAEPPYRYDEYDAKRGREPWEILRVAWDGPFETPHYGYVNSPYSVQAINRGAWPWLASYTYGVSGQALRIWAGTTFCEFIRLVRQGGGEVFLPLEHPRCP